MKKTVLVIAAAFLLLALMPVDSEAISKVGRKHNFLSFYMGSSQIQGSYTGLPFEEFLGGNPELEVEGDVIYDPAFHFGFQYGNLIGKKISVAFGLKYTRHSLKDAFEVRDVLIDGELFDVTFEYGQFDLTFSQYDFEIDANYMFMDIATTGFAPFVGAGVKAGFSNADFKGFQAENDFTASLNLNFGADLKVWQSVDKTDFLTISSMNSFDLLSNDNKARYLNIGGAIKYYFRP